MSKEPGFWDVFKEVISGTADKLSGSNEAFKETNPDRKDAYERARDNVNRDRGGYSGGTSDGSTTDPNL